MESLSKEYATILRVLAHVIDPCFRLAVSMSLKCAIDLNIPDIIHKYGQPMPLSQLIASLPIHPSKTSFLYRLMRILTHTGFLSQHNVIENEQEVRYELTDACTLLVKDNYSSLVSFYQLFLDPTFIKSWYQLPTWFTNEDLTPFHTGNGMSFWEYTECEPKLRHLFNDAMTSIAQFASSMVIEKFMNVGVLKGFESLVDVGGGTGIMAKDIAKSFPHIKSIVVFDLPNVVANLQGTENIKYVQGDMFETIPSADSIMLKNTLHDWNDEKCVKILKNCKEVIPSHGKVIIIDAVLEDKTENEKLTAEHLLADMQMMLTFGAKERNEKEWANLIFSSGFSNYKITPISELFSMIEVYP